MKQASFLMLLMLFLTGCVSTTGYRSGSDSENADQKGYWQLKGRVGLKTPQKSGSFNIFWEQQGDAFDIHLNTSLGLSIAHLKGSHEAGIQSVSIDIPKQGRFKAESAALLLKKHTGLVIPVASLRYWVRGDAAPGEYFEKHENILSQLGWTIEYLEYEDELPVRIKLIQGEIKILLIVHQWNA